MSKKYPKWFKRLFFLLNWNTMNRTMSLKNLCYGDKQAFQAF